MAIYFEYDEKIQPLSGADVFILKQDDSGSDKSVSATIQDLVDDVVQPLIDTGLRLIDTPVSITTHTITESNISNRLVFTNAGSITITLPEDGTEAIADGFQCIVRLENATGDITFVVESGALNSPDALVAITKQYGEVVVTKSASGVWELNGELA